MWNFYIIKDLMDHRLNGSMCSYASFSYASSGQSESGGHQIPLGFSHVETNASEPKLANIHK